MNLRQWCETNRSGFNGELRFEEPLSRHTYYRIGGPAQVLAIPKGRADLDWLVSAVGETGAEAFVLGLGSNVLVSDKGFDGLVIKTGKMNLEFEEIRDIPESLPSGVSRRGQIALRTGSSVPISALLRKAGQNGWGGLQFLTGIPGTVGGVVVMNAGTHLGEAKDRLTAVEVFSFASPQLTHDVYPKNSESMIRFEGEMLRFEYRKNLFIPNQSIVWAAEWLVDLTDPAEVKATIDEALARRKATQPIDYPSCGSVFKNPGDKSAWKVIDELGLRGHRIGDAQFSEKHSNFIVNLDHARAADIRALIDLAKDRARQQFGITLEEEVRYVGF